MIYYASHTPGLYQHRVSGLSCEKAFVISVSFYRDAVVETNDYLDSELFHEPNGYTHINLE